LYVETFKKTSNSRTTALCLKTAENSHFRPFDDDGRVHRAAKPFRK